MVAIPFGAFSINGSAFVLNITEDRLAAAPVFFATSDLNNGRRAEELYSYYGFSPYWTFYGAAPYWDSTPCAGSSCGPEVMNFGVMNFGVAPSFTPLPSDAKPGECYARVFTPPQFKTVTEQVMVKPASERVEVIPAKYEVVDQQVMVKSASKKLEEVPAQYKWVDQQVLLEPAHTEWRFGRGAMERVDHATGEIMCLVEIPAKYETVKKEVLVSPATVREVEIPAQYETVKVTKMTEPPQEKHISVPAEYQTVTKTVKVSDGFTEWKKVECETNPSSGAMK